MLVVSLPIRLLVCGDRNWRDFQLIYTTLQIIGPEDIEVLIEGDCIGADKQAGAAGEMLGIQVIRFPALWTQHGNSAGPIRNRQMMKQGKPTWVLAFHDNIKKSKGTKDMMKVADENRVPCTLITHKKRLPWFTVDRGDK